MHGTHVNAWPLSRCEKPRKRGIDAMNTCCHVNHILRLPLFRYKTGAIMPTALCTRRRVKGHFCTASAKTGCETDR